MLQYTMKRRTSLSRIANKVMDELKPPVAVIMLGHNGQQRQRVLNELIDQFGRRYEVYGCPDIQQLERLGTLKGHWNVHILDLDGVLGGYASTRRAAAKALRDAGAETVVGVFIDEPHLESSSCLCPDQYPDTPRAEEFDYLVVAYDDSLVDSEPPTMSASTTQAPG